MINYRQESPDEIRSSQLLPNGAEAVKFFIKGDIRKRKVDKVEQISLGVNPNGIEGFQERITITEEEYSPWDELLASGVEIEWLDIPTWQAEKDAEEAARDLKAQTKAAKRAGMDYGGVAVSLTEENQLGMASVRVGATIAADAGSSVFPLNFKVATATGPATIVFADLAEFDAFGLQFIAARQQFFQE